jgi:hypothetical protein
MKKLLSIALLSVSTLAITSCSKENVKPQFEKSDVGTVQVAGEKSDVGTVQAAGEKSDVGTVQATSGH